MVAPVGRRRSCRAPLRNCRFDAAPQGHGQLALLQMLDPANRQPGGAEPPRIASSSKPRRMWGSSGAQLVAIMRREIDHEQRPARGPPARRLADRRCRRVRIMKHLVDNDAVGPNGRPTAARTCRPGEGWRQFPAASSFARASLSVSDERSMPIARLERGPEQLDHSPRSRCRCPPAGRAGACQALRSWRARRRTRRHGAKYAVADVGMAGEIAAGGLGPLGADGLGAGRVRSEQRPGHTVAQTSTSANIGST